MHQQKHACAGTELSQPLQAIAVVFQILIGLAALDIEDIYHDTDVLEDGRALGSKVGVHEGVLATTIPEVKDEVTEKTNVILLNVDGGAKA